MDFTLEDLTFENCNKAYEIDRTDIPDSFVDDVPTLIATLHFGYDNKLRGRSFLITKDGKAIGTILLGEGLYCDTDPVELKDKPFYRLVFLCLIKILEVKDLAVRFWNAQLRKSIASLENIQLSLESIKITKKLLVFI